MSTTYDTIGVNYANLRKPDRRIAAMISAALGPAKTILNVGAGTGSYEPTDRQVTAIEPSIEMIAQRSATAAPVRRGFAEDLSFADDSFDASMAILTVHHWTDQAKGLQEMRRVTRGRIVLFTYDPWQGGGWLADYFPEFVRLDERQMPKMTDYEDWLGPVEIVPVPIPHDCTDGFLGAYWRRPAAYLDPKIQTGISCFWTAGNVSAGLDRLAHDLESGAWAKRYSGLLDLDAYDLGYRLVIAEPE